MATFFISDTHFGHAAIIRLSKRPFGSIEEMDDTIIARWNERVSPGDTVFHLGDICFRNARTAAHYVRRSNGEIHLIAGNHDGETIKSCRDLFASVCDLRELRIDGRHIVLCHYPMREWHGSRRGSWHLFGHVHGRLNYAPLGPSMDVGVDSNDFRPWRWKEIVALLSTRTDRVGEIPRG